MSADGKHFRRLTWRQFDQGRMLVATWDNGYFELTMGDCARFVRTIEKRLIATDLGPCSEDTLDDCKQWCEDYISRQKQGEDSGRHRLLPS